MAMDLSSYTREDMQVKQEINVDESLQPKQDKDRKVGMFSYMFMWVGDGVNLGNMTLGASLIAAGVASLNLIQTFVAAILAIGIISIVFALNDRF